MAANCIVPGVLELATDANELSTVSRRLMDNPNPGTLTQAKAAVIKMQLAYKRNQMLAYGPVENQIFWQANFYTHPSPDAIERMIRSQQPIDQKFIERQGAMVKGFSTAEYLVLGLTDKAGLDNAPDSADSRLLQGDTAARRRQYLCAITENLAKQLQAAARQAQAPDFPSRFASGGQASINLLVNELTVTLESGLTIPLQDSLKLSQAKNMPGKSGNITMGYSIPEMKALLQGLIRFYHAGEGRTGLNDYMLHVNPGLNNRLEAQFNTTSAALSAINKPLDTMVATQRPVVQTAFEETHRLELLLKVDLTSALGVTIMFNAYDGD